MLPVTGLCVAVTDEPYEVVVPYSNVTVVDEPLALTVPFSVAEVHDTDVVAFVVADGPQSVVNVWSLPYTVPQVLTAFTL